jgi:hypothetical protein
MTTLRTLVDNTRWDETLLVDHPGAGDLDILNCPLDSEVGEACADLMQQADELIELLADVGQQAQCHIRDAVAKQCRVFYYG